MSKIADKVCEKTAGEIKIYQFEFADELGTNETISTAVASVSPTGPTLGTANISGTKVQVSVTGGTAGTTYLITIRITTSLSQTIDGSGYLDVTEN